jgi:cation diffusion facilitator family transporter
MRTDSKSLQVITRASLISALTNASLSALKIIFGILGFSYALTTDGIHSLSDVVIDGLVVVSARMGRAAPDIDHPYGHRRIETIGTIVVSLIILGVGLSLCVENLLRILNHTPAQHPSPIVFIVAFISVIANEWLYHYMLKKSRAIHSKLLQSNAWHNRSDAITSVVVMISTVFSWLGWHKTDAIAAIIISVLVIKMGATYTWKSLKELIDTGVDPELVTQLEEIIAQTPGVISLHQLRTRMHADQMLLDGHLQVCPTLSVSEGHFITTTAIQSIQKIAPNLLDATLHIDVEHDQEHDQSDIKKLPPDRDCILKQLHAHQPPLIGLNQLKNVTLHYLSQRVKIEILLPLSLLNNYEYAEILVQYRTCLYLLSDIESVAINFFRD